MDEAIVGWKAALRILSDEVNPDEVTATLGIQPARRQLAAID